MKKAPILFLQIAIVGLALVVLGLGALALPNIFNGWALEYPNMANARYPFVIGLGLTILPFLFALTQGMKLLVSVQKNTAFSAKSTRALKNIKNAALSIAFIYAAELPIIFNVAQTEDAPGLILIWSALFVGIPLVIAVFSGVVQQLLQNVIDIKSENDLTV